MNILRDFNLNKSDILKFFDLIINNNKKTVNELLHILNLNSERIFKIDLLKFLINYLILNDLIKIHKDNIELHRTIKSSIVYNGFCIFFINEIIKDNKLYNELFIKSEYKVIDSKLVININSIKLKYRGYYKIFHQLEIVKKLNNNNLIIMNYTLAKNLLNIPLKAISLKEFEEELENKKIRGEMAEKYVMNYELDKLKNLKLKPFQVSKYNVSAGYDIDSYNLKKEKIFIEVKSIIQNRFYWTSNEIKNSKNLKDNYFIYCIRFKDNKPEKIEKIIQHPYHEIFIKKNYINKSNGDFQVFLN